MVLAHKVGKERSFPVVVLLFVITFGIYGIFWHYKAHEEVFKQFELEKEGREQGIVWLILGYVLQYVIGFIGTILLWVYLYGFVGNVQYVRQRIGLRQGLTPGAFLGLVITAGVIVLVGVIAAVVVLFASVEDPEAFGDEGYEFTDDDVAALVTAIAVGAVAVLISVILQLVAYARLQGDLNRIWQAYDRRMGQLASGPPGGAPPGPPGPGGPRGPPDPTWG